MDELRALERPVALVFFGDHQPSVAEWANDALFGDEDEQARLAFEALARIQYRRFAKRV